MPHRICFAVKANSNLAVLRVFRDLGAGADIVSGGELRRALAAGFPPDRIVFSGVGKSPAELEAALAAGVGHIHLESADELAQARRRSRSGSGRTAPVGIRVNPDVTAETHPYIATGQGGIKFGVPFDQVLDAGAGGSPRTRGSRLDSIAMHIGSQILDPAPVPRGRRPAGRSWCGAIRRGGHRHPAEPRHRRRPRHPLQGRGPARSRRASSAAVCRWPGRPGSTLVLEPGRFLVGSAGVLLTTVLSRKHSGGKELVLVDAGMNDLVRPSHYHGLSRDRRARGARAGRRRRWTWWARSARPATSWPATGRCPGSTPGERLAVLGAGAYGFVMAPTTTAGPGRRRCWWMAAGGPWSGRGNGRDLYAGETAEPAGSPSGSDPSRASSGCGNADVDADARTRDPASRRHPDHRLRLAVHPAHRAAGARGPRLLRDPPAHPARSSGSGTGSRRGSSSPAARIRCTTRTSPPPSRRCSSWARRCSGSATACSCMAHLSGGKVERADRREYGRADGDR